MAKANRKSRTNKQLQADKEQPFVRWFISGVFTLVKRFGNIVFICATVAYCANQISIAVQSLSGQATLADLRIGFLANITFVWTFSLTLSGVSVTLYLLERKLHRKTRERLAARNIELELKIDPNRASSKLTSEGLTREEDR